MVILVILTNTDNNTVDEISKRTGVKREAVFHLLEFLTLAKVVKKNGDKYYVDDTIRTTARLLLDFRNIDEKTN